MKKINWKVRVKNKSFWLTVIPAVLIIVQLIGSMFGITIDLSTIQETLLSILNAVFIILAALGIVVDHTTAGISDSEQVLEYVAPKSDKENAKELLDLAQNYNDENRSDFDEAELEMEI